MTVTVIDTLCPLVGEWFTARYGEPTEPQIAGWPIISAPRWFCTT